MLFSRPFLITTRPVEKVQGTPDQLCFDLLNIPVTKIIRKSYDELAGKIFPWKYDGIVLTSSIGSSMFLGVMDQNKVKFNGPAYCIGEKTAEPLRNAGMEVIVPENKETEGLLEIVSEHGKRSSRLLLFRSGQGNPALRKGLEKMGFQVSEVICYNTEPFNNPEMKIQLEREGIQGIIFTSSMEVLSFLMYNPAESIETKHIFAIGYPTREVLTDHGFRVSEPFGKSDIRKLVSEIADKYCSDSGELI